MIRLLMLMLLGAHVTAAIANNTVESCYVTRYNADLRANVQVTVGSVCYNHGIYSVKESHIRERCNNAVEACKKEPGGCYSKSCIGCGVGPIEGCKGHDGEEYIDGVGPVSKKR